jgi:DNA-binding CsgD family transcriptional regulator
MDDKHTTPTHQYWDRISKISASLNIPPIRIFAVFMYVNTGEYAWMANKRESVKAYTESGLYRADVLQCAQFRKENRVIYTDEYANLDPTQTTITKLMRDNGFSRIYCLSRFCGDCSVLLAANNIGDPLENPESIYKDTVDNFEDFCIHFIDEMLDVYLEALPTLEQTRFATDPTFRAMVIKNRSSAPHAKLSKGEREVLYWAGQGKTSEETGLLMNLTKSTLETYRKRAIAKLNASNITHAVYLAKLYHLIA